MIQQFSRIPTRMAENLFTQDDLPKIADFGLAKHELHRVDSDRGRARHAFQYMAPEQATGDNPRVGPTADVYALGAILYELITGRPPFRGATVLDTLDQVRTQEPVPPLHLQPRTPRDLNIICLKCLQKELHKRYASADELADDLRRFRAGEMIRARATDSLEKTWRWSRRNPALSLLSASLILVVLAGVGISLGFASWALQKPTMLASNATSPTRVLRMPVLGPRQLARRRKPVTNSTRRRIRWHAWRWVKAI